MKLIVLILLVLPTIIALCGAIYLAAKGKEGWGWLLFVALLIAPSFRILQEFQP